MSEIDLEKIINHRIVTLALLLKREAYRVIAENKLDITPEQWVVLYYLWQEDALLVGELVKKSKKDFANISRIVEKLIASGYIEKKRSKDDGRSFRVYLLPKAGLIRNKVNECWLILSDILKAGISEEEQAFFLNILDKMERNLFAEQDGFVK